MDYVMILLAGLLLGGVFILVVTFLMRRRGKSAPVQVVGSETIAERVRAVGKLVGLEVHAKEIATTTKGWSWIPPLLLSQAKLAMIFSFERQYYVDLHRLTRSEVEEVSPGRYRIRLPGIEGSLRLADVTPYDIQAGRILGLLDVIPMNAESQKELMKTAQVQAAQLFERNEAKYLVEAQRVIGSQLEALLSLFDVRVDIEWSIPTSVAPAGEMVLEKEMQRKLTGAV